MIPPIKHQLELGPRSEGPTRYIHADGMPFLAYLDGGVAFPQTYCTALAKVNNRVRFTDDVIFSSNKTKLFQVVVLLDKPSQAIEASGELDGIDHFSHGHLSADEAIYLVQAKKCSFAHHGSEFGDLAVFRTATAEEFEQSDLCVGRPIPHGYNDSQIWNVVGGKRFVIVRYDRVVYAACDTGAEMVEVSQTLADLLPLS